jgi:hypothetical protein
MNLNLKKFDMRRIQFKNDADNSKGPVIVLSGKRDTGKSVLVKDILYHHKDLPYGVVISGTEEANEGFKNLVPKMFIYKEYHSLILENVLKRQKTVLKQIKMDYEKYNKSNVDPRTFIILDDCLFDNKWTTDKIMRLLFMNGRHWKIMLIITMQYPLGIPPVLRTNVDFMFILRDNNNANRKRLYENYAGMFPTFEFFCQVMNQCTENYECLVIDNNVKSNKLEDQVYFYKAELNNPSFHLGDRSYWDLSKSIKCEDDDYDKYDETKQTKKGAQIIVKKKW